MGFMILWGVLVIGGGIGLLFFGRKVRKANKEYDKIIKKMDGIKRSLRYGGRRDL